jgi:hypothetical protein
MTSSTISLANQNRPRLRAISEFANMGDAPDCWRAFRKRWPSLFPAKLYTDSEAEIQHNIERAKHPVVAAVPTTVYELTGEVRQVVPAGAGKWVDFREPDILRLRNLLRDAWRGGSTVQQSIDELLGLSSPSLVGGYFAERSPTISADWLRASLVFLPRDEFQAACYTLLRSSNLAKFCANPDCPAPYFIAKRATQRYCSPDCLKPFQKQWKLDWWNREGKARRAEASSESRKQRRKNVTRKAR